MKNIEQITKEVKPNLWYYPQTIAKKSWIVNSKGKGDYFYILKLIKKDCLRAKNFGLGKVPYYRIKGSEILRFVKEFYL